jgi:hypothetical protein
VATRIGELKKPTVSAWLVNQLARSRELDVQRLIKAGEALEQAQRDAMSGEATDFDTARRDEGDAIRRLSEAAKELQPSASTAMLDRVAKTLRAAAASSDGRALLKQGRLEEDLEPPGFEALAGLAAPASLTARKRRTAPSARRPTRREETLRRRKEEADEKAERAAEEAKELERAAREAEQAAGKARRAAESARKRAGAAAAQADRIEAELQELRERA